MTQTFLKPLILANIILAGLASQILPFAASADVISNKKSLIAPPLIINNQINNQLDNQINNRQPATNAQNQPNSNLIPPLSPPLITKNSGKSGLINSEKIEKVEVILENRTSGCRAIANKTINLQPNLCPKPNISPNILVAARSNDRQNFNQSYGKNSDKSLLYPLPFASTITSGFGWRVHPISGKTSFHQGVDLAASTGTPVFAAYSGTIAVADWLGGLGKAVVISHGNGSETRYGHLSQILVQPGQSVKQGAVIGLVGSTGASTGPHLHFELWRQNSGEWSSIDASNLILGALDNFLRYGLAKN